MNSPAFIILFAMAAAVAAADVKPQESATPEMLDAMNRLDEAGRETGRRGSLTFFRWSSANPPKLAHLGLWGERIDNELLALTTAMPDLEYVSLYETRVDDEGLQVLAKLPKLRALAVLPVERYEKAGFGPPQWSYPFLPRLESRPRLTGKSLQSLTAIQTLEKLDLREATLQPSDLATLAAWPKLGSLGIPCVVNAEVVRHLHSCRRLSHLTLGHRAITAIEIEHLAAWKSLRRLSLVHATLEAEALRALSRLESVETLELNSCDLRDDDLRHLHGSPKLVELILSRNEIDGPGLAHLADLPVKTLQLDFNNLRDETLRHLVALTNIEKLNLSYCFGITDIGIRSGALQGMTGLREINLRGIKTVTDACVDDLAKLSHLQHIGIRQNGISNAGYAHLKQSLPQTTVFK